jgi:hypothetical protein
MGWNSWVLYGVSYYLFHCKSKRSDDIKNQITLLPHFLLGGSIKMYFNHVIAQKCYSTVTATACGENFAALHQNCKIFAARVIPP